MSLAIGTQLGSHEITALLGKGGMGEVYRARDLKLKREVAIKILPEDVSRDEDRVNRFQREAEVLASLNHPNIAAIYGLERSADVQALVLELVDGPTLADRIALGPLPIEEVLPIARQLAEALEYAHESGVIHRDLKPANIKLTADGRLKVLDFGLAKALSNDSRTSTTSNSPTLSLAATQAGIILGTAAYMSPEQAKGKAVDRRADIWAFGVVVYEMLTGRMVFSGETASETMAHVMVKEPDWDALPANTPLRLRDLLRRCLLKDPRKRMRDIGEVRLAIEDIVADPEPRAETTTRSETPSSGRRLSVWTAALGLALGAGFVLSIWQPWHTAAPGTPVRLSAELGADVSLASNILSNSALAFSPDGSRLAFVAVKNGAPPQFFICFLVDLKSSGLY
jgi:serine/threonine-protein kinase